MANLKQRSQEPISSFYYVWKDRKKNRIIMKKTVVAARKERDASVAWVSKMVDSSQESSHFLTQLFEWKIIAKKDYKAQLF